MPEVRPLDSGRWGVRWRDALGQRHSAGFSFPTKAAARAYGQDREAEVRRGEDLDPRAGRVLLGDYAQAWLDETYIAEPRTVAKVRTHVTRYIKAPVGDARALGDMRLTDLDSRAVQAWVKRLIDLGRAPATVAAIHRTLCTILNAAVKDRSIRANPALDDTGHLKAAETGESPEAPETREDLDLTPQGLSDEPAKQEDPDSHAKPDNS